jgi:hypothetical protein
MELNDKMTFHLEVSAPEDAAELQLAIEACGYKFNVVEIQPDAPQLIIGSAGVEFDPDDLREHLVIRFIIEPNKNPVAQGFEIASMIMTIRGMLQAGKTETAEDIIEAIEMSNIQEAGPEMRERFDMLQRKFAGEV